jgi:lysophospholipase L1-like esterase
MTTRVVGASFVEPGSPLVAELGVKLGSVVTHGVRGSTVAKWLEAFKKAVPVGTRDPLLVFEMGGNGVTSSDAVKRAHAELVTRARDVRWVLPPEWPIAGTVKTNRDAARAAILAANVPTIRHGWQPSRSDLSGDGQHLTPAGYRKFADAVAAVSSSSSSSGATKVIAGALVVLAIGAFAVHATA